MTAKMPITSDQRKQYKRFVQDGSKRALEEVKPDKDGLQKLFQKGDKFHKGMVALIKSLSAKAPDYSLAGMILGANFISPEEIATSRGTIYTEEQLANFGNTLPSQEVMEWCRDNGYMLVAGPAKPMSLLEIRQLKSDYFYYKKESESWYSNEKEEFSRIDKVETRWLMLKKEPVADSTSKTWGKQQKLLSKDEVVPNAAEVVWGMTTYKAVREINLFPSIYVRTSSRDSGGNRVSVGDFDSVGLIVSNDWDDGGDGDLGVSASRKQ